MTGQSSLENVPTYTDLFNLLREKADLVTELRQKLEEITADALGIACEKD